MRRFLSLAIGALALCLAVSCTSPVSRWSDPANWYDDGRQVDEDLADVFYLVSTDILAIRDADGGTRYISAVTDADREVITPEMVKVAKDMGDSLNFFSPYYRQFSFETLDLAPDAYRDTAKIVLEDVWEAFSYYLEHLNNGRPFALVGFSQGAMYIPELIARMDNSQYSRMAGAYMMGYRLSADDLKLPHLRAAAGADDIGTVVSFNSVASGDALWPLVNEGAVTCINPLNWKTDSTPANMLYYGDMLTFHIDTELNTIIVDGTDPVKFDFPMLDRYCKKGNLHHWDRKFYADAIRENILHRTALLRDNL